MKSTLAIFGGQKAVKNPPQERWKKINKKVKTAVMRLLDESIVSISDGSGVISEFESAFASMEGTKYALAMNSGTATLHSAYFAIGVGPGDEVIVPSYTWHASITPILHCSATPIFCDISPDTLTANPDDIERKITAKTKAVCIVHVWGNVCDMDRITDITRRHNIALIEDASHAHGAQWKGKPVGSLGDVGCFSCQGGKAVSGGECGVAVTDDPDIVDSMILLGHFGRKKLGTDSAIDSVGDMSLGAKYRPHPWAIALANVELARLPLLNKLRTRNYKLLNNRLRSCPGIEIIESLPEASRGGYLEFKFKLSKEVLEVVSRDRIVEAMVAEGVPIKADRYSSFNYTYGLLHTAPLFTTFNRHAIGGCFYDPTLTMEKEANYARSTSLPIAEDLAQRLVGIHAFADVEVSSLEETSVGIIKVMEHVEEIANQ